MTEKDNDKDIQRMYHDLAWTWPIISPPEDYVEETEIMAEAIRKYSMIPSRTLLNLGCGGGHEDKTLKKYFQITGVDLSKDMLKLARDLNPENKYIEGDLRGIKLDEKFDASIATSLAYMKSRDELSSAFQTIYKHLNPGGVFITFAEITTENFQQNKLYCTKHKSNDIEIVYIENYFDPDPTDITFEITLVYLIRRRGELEIHHDFHICGLFSLHTWLELLNETGFEVIIQNVELSVASELETFPMLICIKPVH